jgi:predicted RNA methylase
MGRGFCALASRREYHYHPGSHECLFIHRFKPPGVGRQTVTTNFFELDPSHSVVVTIGDERNELVAAECQVLSGVAPVNGVAAGSNTAFIQRAAYQQFGLQVVASAPDLALLCAQAATLLNLDDFKVSVIARGSNGQQRRAMGLAVAEAIQAKPNLDRPEHQLVLIEAAGHYALGEIVTEPDRSYQNHDQKPQRTSASLPSRLARALVNLVPVNAVSMLDPCCGSGALVLEACAIGLQVFCGDINANMVNKTTENLAYFGYDCCVIQQDARAWQQPVDAIVTDLPYGKYSRVADDVALGIFAQAAKLAPIGVFVAGMDLSAQMLAAGYTRVEVFAVPKAKGFQRYVHRGLV